MKTIPLLALTCLVLNLSAGQSTFRKAIFLHHSVGDVIYHGSYENTPIPTTVPIEIGKYNTAHGFTGSNVVSMDEPSTRLWPAGGPYGTSENDWWYWQQILSGQDNNSPTFASFLGSYPVIIIKTCFLSEEWMATDDSIAAYKSHYRAVVGLMAQRPDHFFVIWNNYPAYYTGAANSLRSLLFSKWAKDTLATGMDSFGPLPRNVYVFDVFRKIADPVTGIEPLQDIIGGGDEHPSNAAVGIVTPAFVREAFDAAIAYESSANPTLVNVTVFLQGPYIGPLMSTGLNSSGILAAHFGTGHIPALAVDSINIEIRDSIQAATSTIRRFVPAWLIADGSIRDFTDTTKRFIGVAGVAPGNYYIVVRHRNHLAVMSASSVGLTAASPPAPYDFTTDQAKAYGSNAQLAIASRFAMFGGDGNGDGGVDTLDKNTVWRSQDGKNGYLAGDFNMDGGVDALDANLIWKPNNGIGSQVP